MTKAGHAQYFMVAVCSLVVLLAFMSGCGPASPAPAQPAAAPAPRIEWNFTVQEGAKGTLFNPAFAKMIEAVKQRTNGGLTIHVRYIGEMFSIAEHEVSVRDGVVPMSTGNASWIAGKGLPEMEALSNPYLASTVEEWERAMRALKPTWDKWLRAWGVEPFAYHTSPPPGLFSEKPVTTIEGMKGLKVRTTGVGLADLVKATGGVPVTMDATELYLGMQRGVVNAAWGGPQWGMETVKLNEVVKNVNLWSPYWWTLFVGVNPQELAKLPAEYRAVLIEELGKVGPTLIRNAGENDKQVVELAKKFGMTANFPASGEVAKLTALMQPSWEKWAAGSGDHGKEALSLARKELAK